MADNVTIFKVDTGEAVQSVNDLKNNIKTLKDNLGDLEIGTEDYQKTLRELQKNQAAVKDAMYATSSSMEEIAASASGASNSYNSLVHRMAELKGQLRATDVSTEEGKQKFKELAGQINEVNDTLKEMDALQGNFQRNVGNYPGLMKTWSGSIDALDKGFKSATHGLGGLKNGFDALAVNPAIAVIGIVGALLAKMADSLKENETAMEAVSQAGVSLKPIMDFFKGVLEKVAVVLAEIVGKVSEFVQSNGIIPKVTEAIAGVGNAIFKFVVAPFKAVAAAIKVFQEEGVSGIKNATKAFADEMKSGVSFTSNYTAGTAAVDGIIAGVKSKSEDVKDAGKGVAKDLFEGMQKELDKQIQDLDKQMEADMLATAKEIETAAAQTEKAEADADARRVKNQDRRLKDLDKMTAHVLKVNQYLVDDEATRAEKAYEIQRNSDEQKLAMLRQYAEDAMTAGNLDEYLDYQQQVADLEVEMEERALAEKKRIRDKDKADKKKHTKDMMNFGLALAKSTASVLGSIADMYEQDEENAEKNAVKIKALRISESIINTLTGAIGTYMQTAATIPAPAGPILGAISAAAVTAAGVVQIAQLSKTPVGSKGASSGGAPSLSVPAPSLPTDVTQVHNITSASDENRLNEIASDQRVYILSSDIEASQNQRKAQVAETSW